MNPNTVPTLDMIWAIKTAMKEFPANVSVWRNLQAAADTIKAADGWAGQVVLMREALWDVLSSVDALEKQGSFGVNEEWAVHIKGMAHDSGDVALSLPLLEAVAQVREWREKAGLLEWLLLAPADNAAKWTKLCYGGRDWLEALRAAKEQG